MPSRWREFDFPQGGRWQGYRGLHTGLPPNDGRYTIGYATTLENYHLSQAGLRPRGGVRRWSGVANDLSKAIKSLVQLKAADEQHLLAVTEDDVYRLSGRNWTRIGNDVFAEDLARVTATTQFYQPEKKYLLATDGDNNWWTWTPDDDDNNEVQSLAGTYDRDTVKGMTVYKDLLWLLLSFAGRYQLHVLDPDDLEGIPTKVYDIEVSGSPDLIGLDYHSSHQRMYSISSDAQTLYKIELEDEDGVDLDHSNDEAVFPLSVLGSTGLNNHTVTGIAGGFYLSVRNNSDQKYRVALLHVSSSDVISIEWSTVTLGGTEWITENNSLAVASTTDEIFVVGVFTSPGNQRLGTLVYNVTEGALNRYALPHSLDNGTTYWPGSISSNYIVDGDPTFVPLLGNQAPSSSSFTSAYFFLEKVEAGEKAELGRRAQGVSGMFSVDGEITANVPLTGRSLATYQGRVFLLNTNNGETILEWSNDASLEEWPTGNFLHCTVESEGMALHPHRSVMLVFHRESIHALRYEYTETSLASSFFVNDPVDLSRGLIATKSVVSLDNQTYFLSDDGPCVIASARSKSNYLGRPLERLWRLLDQDMLPEAVAIVRRRPQREIIWLVSLHGDQFDLALVYNVDIAELSSAPADAGWTVFTLPTAPKINDAIVVEGDHEDRVLFCTEDGQVLEAWGSALEPTGYEDLGEPVRCIFESGLWDFGSSDRKKGIREVVCEVIRHQDHVMPPLELTLWDADKLLNTKTINPALLSSASSPAPTSVVAPEHIVWHNSKLYVVQTAPEGDRWLLTIHQKTGALLRVVRLSGVSSAIQGVASTGSTLYMLSQGDLYTGNTSSGRLTLLHSLSLPSGWSPQALTHNRRANTGLLYVLVEHNTATRSRIYSISIANGTTSLVGEAEEYGGSDRDLSAFAVREDGSNGNQFVFAREGETGLYWGGYSSADWDFDPLNNVGSSSIQGIDSMVFHPTEAREDEVYVADKAGDAIWRFDLSAATGRPSSAQAYTLNRPQLREETLERLRAHLSGSAQYLRLRVEDPGEQDARYALNRITMRYMFNERVTN